MPSLDCDSDIMAALKLATRTQHSAVERLMPFFESHFSLQTYIRVLESFLGFFEPIESGLRSIAHREASAFTTNRGQRAQLLKTDLQALGFTPSEVSLLPRCTHLPKLESADDALGCLYVLEGSTLGGQVIARTLKSRLGLDDKTGAAFFSGYGAETQENWRQFCSTVRNYAAGSNRPGLIASARSTFECLEAWMRKADFQ